MTEHSPPGAAQPQPHDAAQHRVRVFLFREDGRFPVLVQRRSGELLLPGGRVERGETGRAALSRELVEELALAIPEDAFQEVYAYVEQPRGRRRTAYEFFTSALPPGARVEVQEPDNHHPDVHWARTAEDVLALAAETRGRVGPGILEGLALLQSRAALTGAPLRRSA
jgi:8-oxo-dGTP pyrophosphatase MutT (NUDIX family)